MWNQQSSRRTLSSGGRTEPFIGLATVASGSEISVCVFGFRFCGLGGPTPWGSGPLAEDGFRVPDEVVEALRRVDRLGASLGSSATADFRFGIGGEYDVK